MLLHGFGADRLSWLANQPAIEKAMPRRRSICRAMARRAWTLAMAAVETLARHVAAALDAHAAAPLHVVGHSLGGAVAMRLARRPPRPRALARVDRPRRPGQRRRCEFSRRLSEPHRARRSGGADAPVWRRANGLISKLMVKRALDQLERPGARAALRHDCAGDRCERIRRSTPPCAPLGASDVLRAWSIWGREDAINPLDDGKLTRFGGETFDRRRRRPFAAHRRPHRGQRQARCASWARRADAMAKLRRGTQTALAEGASLRLRAAWLYYKHAMTQKDVAEQLGVSRTTVIRLLDEALARGEVRIWIDEGEAGCMALAVELERRLKLDEAIVVPEARGAERTANAVGLALGKFLSEAIADGMTIGVGWGRTLNASLASFRPPRRTGVKVLSLLGGTVGDRPRQPGRIHLAPRQPARRAVLSVSCARVRRFGGDQAAADGRVRAGSARCDRARAMDLAVVSVGDVGPRRRRCRTI